MTDIDKIKDFVEKRFKNNFSKRHAGAGGSFYYAKAEEDEAILAYIKSLQ